MKVSTPYLCDGCNVPKQPSNNWWLIMPKSLSDGADGIAALLVMPWSDVYADDPGVKHICSEACAVKALSKWLGGGK